jgi:hypothetical protein
MLICTAGAYKMNRFQAVTGGGDEGKCREASGDLERSSGDLGRSRRDSQRSQTAFREENEKLQSIVTIVDLECGSFFISLVLFSELL